MKFQSNIKYLILLAIFAQTFTSCEDVVDIDTDPLTPQLVVDAWLDNRSETQTVFLAMSQPYFENNLPEGVSGAVVQVIRDDGEVFEFEETKDGYYTWTPTQDEHLGEVGNEYGLVIELEGKTYGSISTMNRVPVLDSLTQRFEEESLGFPEGIYTEFFARDFIGEGDTYWIKTFKNGDFLNKPDELNIAFDAGFAPGSAVDGLIFIPPIRDATNRVADADGEDDGDVPPWTIGDDFKVEIHSISNEAFFFLATAQRQMVNGNNGIFSEPVINTTGNVVNVNDENETVLGVFNVSAVSEMSISIE